jgi:alkylhydroperoxidase/carboxymuconolactone decarboxylase family protein YurZ
VTGAGAAQDAVATATPKAAAGMRRVREAVEAPSALDAGEKALIVACAAAARGDDQVVAESLARAREAGVTTERAWATPATLLLARGEPAAGRLATALLECYGPPPVAGSFEDLDREGALGYFGGYFGGTVPDRVALLAERAPAVFEGYALMHQAILRESTALPPVLAELILCAVNAAEYQTVYATIHADAARRAGAGEDEILEAMLAVIPIAGVAVWPVAASVLSVGS